MQFLSDVYLRCPECDGRRYRSEVLEVQLVPGGHSMADVLAMTVNDALAYFADYADIQRVLEPLSAVGLGYLALGQPVPTLSGGEAQRLKLAGFLAKAKQRDGRTLFLFDEPTTGLHFSDIAVLLQAFRRLLAAGHSLVVIEHNLDVIGAADWVVDLGPEGGEEGGKIVAEGTPDQVMACAASHTGRALAEYLATLARGAQSQPVLSATKRKPGSNDNGLIQIQHAREHNLKQVDIEIPRNKFTVVTGISGSGKSTVAFDILFAEGQRRYLESLNAYARQFVQPSSRPEVDSVRGVPPTVAIEQRTSRGGRKSTVATMTEVYHFLRLLFVKMGIQYCPDCDAPIEAQSPDAIAARLLTRHRGKQLSLLAPLVVARKGYYTDLAQWAANKGFAQLRVDGEMMATEAWPRLDRFKEHTIDLPVTSLRVSTRAETALRESIDQTLALGNGVLKVLVGDMETLYSIKRACPTCSRSFDELDPRMFSFNSKHGWCESCYGTGLKLQGFDEAQSGEEIWWNDWFEGEATACPQCHGERLRDEALAVRYRDRSISEFAQLSVADAQRLFGELQASGREAEIATDVLSELRSRLGFLNSVGLGYLTLDRSAPTLSGGEAQRIRLAAQLGSNLRGVCYILDEPTIGLHPRDNALLLETLKLLQAKGNTVVVVEHDEATIRQAQHIIDLGPLAGKQGGELVVSGSLQKVMRCKRSLTGRMLEQPLQHPLFARRGTTVDKRKGAGAMIEIGGAQLNNLRKLNVRIPLQRLVCVTGVSGSGKSTLVREVLRENLSRRLSRKARARAPVLLGCSSLSGFESVARVLEVDQTPIGKTPRSCPATYVGIWDHVRKLFAQTSEARLRGYSASRFSFNVKGGRCDACDGQGFKTIEMSFLPDVKVACGECRGARFNGETLAVEFKGKNIGEVLAMEVDEAVEYFAVHTPVRHTLQLLQDVGLGYLTLGQQSPTLSGGEAQRIKLVTELAKAPVDAAEGLETKAPQRRARRGARTLYVLDEPTIGLHMADVEKLIGVLHRLVDAGNSVVVIEHNLDVIAEADWIIDLGPEGGDGGGQVVAQGAPETVVGQPRSHTAKFLAELLQRKDLVNRL
jgi:excinuclease ABC subunit A